MNGRHIILATSIVVAPAALAGQNQPAPQAPTAKPAAPTDGRDSKPAPATAATPNPGGLDPAAVLKPLSDSWPTYSVDMTGRRYSALTQVNQTTVKNLTLAWTSRLVQGSGGGGFGRGGFGAPIVRIGT